ncbi:MAG: FAD-binding oxidoreductase [bacterium]|nr:FAD-binding oxidoreductase [bacterium]
MKAEAVDVCEALEGLGIACDASIAPIALPENEEQAQQVMLLAGQQDWRVLPVGFGGQLPHVQPDAAAFDLWLSTRCMEKVVLYEPGEATISVQPGVLWQDVQELVDRNRQCISPTLHTGVSHTVGGVIAAGFSGLDRPLFGALRHQVLGMRILMADGSIAITGGRLVKNVAGFDLHRLHTGGRGQLGMILEASLRLHNRPKDTAHLSREYDSTEAGVAAVRRLHSSRLPGCALLLQISAEGKSLLSCGIQGSAGLVEDGQRTAALAMDFEVKLRGAEATRERTGLLSAFELGPCEPWLSITCQPTAIEEVQQLVWGWLGDRDLLVSGLLQPDVAHWLLKLEGAQFPDGSALLALRGELGAMGAVLSVRGALCSRVRNAGVQTSGPLQQTVEALRQQFDPNNRFQPRQT